MHGSAPSLVDTSAVRHGLYTESQRLRRDATVWTLVQGVLAPIQFLIFLISLALVLRYLVLESGYEAAAISVVVKTTALYLIMITGAVWEKWCSANICSPPPSYGKTCSVSPSSPCIPIIYMDFSQRHLPQIR